MCPKKRIISCARYYMCVKKCIIACARYCIRMKNRVSSCSQRNASLHCARDCIVPEVCISPRLHRARIKSGHKYQQMPKTNTLSLLITYIPKASSSKVIIFHGLRTPFHCPRTKFMLVIFLRYHSLKASSSWHADIISWPKGLISVYHDPKVS